MKIMTVVGARPNFMKVGPILQAISDHNARRSSSEPHVKRILVHTGQHYDAVMSAAFFADLNLPKPDIFLGVGFGSHAVQTAEIMKRFEQVLLEQEPDVVVVVGDVNSTVACALVTAKISGENRPRIAHVEAGLRSFDRSMPEECNRVVTDHLSDFLFVTEESGLANLAHEGIPSEKVFFVGNTMIDTLMAFGGKADQSQVLERLGLYETQKPNRMPRSVKQYALLTLHRPSNVDGRDTLMEIIAGLGDLVASHDIVFPVHPRTRKNIQQNGLEEYFDSSSMESAVSLQQRRIKLVEPQGYLDFVCLMKHARVVVTDSGGIQEETTCLGVPCVTVRENTERPVTITAGTNVLAGVRRQGIRETIRRQLTRVADHAIPEKWDGRAAERILRALVSNAQPVSAVPAPIAVEADVSVSSRGH